MPRIINYTPGWLSRPSPGFQIFNKAHSTSSQASSNSHSQQRNGNFGNDQDGGPNRTIAQRGTEIYLAIGRQIRWADLVSLKDGYEEQLRTPTPKPKPATEASQSDGEDNGPEDGSYRVLKVPIGEKIRQVSVSPNGDLLAIATSHTVHIAILPDSSHLGQIPNRPIKLKTYTVGPTSHVLSQAAVTNILWHPCGAGGNCLVTVTTDAIIRLWEFNREDRMSSAEPSLAIDLKKLIFGTSEEENFAPEKFQRNRRFSSDTVGLEVASACFGGNGSSHESGWSAMTLWIAMRSGDIYALCPLLPSKWQASVTLISSLSTAAVDKEASMEDGDSSDPEEERQCQDQLQWIRDVDGQEPAFAASDEENALEFYNRPSHPGPISRLQGPFQMFPEEIDEDLDFSDIHIIPSMVNPEEFMNDDDSDSETGMLDEPSLSAAIVVLITRSGRTYICLDLEGIEGQWLPRKKPKRLLSPPKDPYLLVFEALETLSPTQQLDLHWPTFSSDGNSRYSFFSTHGNGVFSFSLDPWVERLEKELKNSETLGAALRVDLIKNGSGTTRERILSFDEDEDSGPFRSNPACQVFHDSDLGHFLLTSVNGHPEAVTFDEPDLLYERPLLKIEDGGEEDQMPEMSLLNLGPARTVYQPSDSFFKESELLKSYENSVKSRHRKTMKHEIRLSTVTLDVMTQAHRVLSQETHRLGIAASDLFRRCQRLRDELSDQVNRTREVVYRAEKVAGEDADLYLDTIKSKSPPSLGDRLQKVQRRQEELADRYENLRKKFNNTGGRQMSEKERLWVAEVAKAHNSIASPPTENGEEDKELTSELWHRCREAEDLKEGLLAHAKDFSQDEQQRDTDDPYMVSDDDRRKKLAQVQNLLGTQNRLVEEAQLRLQRLSEPAVS